MQFDIAALEAATSKTFDVVVGTRDDGGRVGFTVVGSASEQYQTAIRAIDLLNVKESAARKSTVDMASDAGAEIVVDGGAKRRDLLLDACVVEWFGFTLGANEPAPFTPENFRRVMKAKPTWRLRLLTAIEDDANFAAG